MRFSELNEDQKKFYHEYFKQVISIKCSQREQFIFSILKLLLAGNASSILLLVTFLAQAISKGYALSYLIYALILFIFGTIFAAALYFPLMVVANDGVVHTANNIQKVMHDQIGVQDLQGYGLTPKGRRLISIFGSLSVLFFIAGIIVTVISLMSYIK